MSYIDFHAHVFPDHLAERTIPALEAKGNVTAALDGRLSSLLASMSAANITQSVICSIATKPSQFESILDFSRQIQSGSIIPFPSLHPEDPDRLARVSEIRAAGFKGIKLHPYYQDFAIDENRMLPVYEQICREGLILLMHTGFDIGFPYYPIASPERILNVVTRFPELKLVTTHLGAWRQWDEVREILLGKPIYMDISFSLQFMTRDEARDFISRHRPEYVLFGSDSPWADQQTVIEQFQTLDLGPEMERLVFHENARKLLDSVK